MKKLLIVILILIPFTRMFSCSCDPSYTIEDNWKDADEVFKGKIVKIDSSQFGNYGERLIIFTVRILKSYKKPFFPRSEFRTIISSDARYCDFLHFSLCEEYLIFGNYEGRSLICGECSHTEKYEEVKKDELALLSSLEKNYKAYAINRRKIREVSDEERNKLLQNCIENKKSTPPIFISLIIGLIIALSAIFFYFWKKNKN